ncbi:group I intron-associated PD-(D/E)XK endonuclease [Nostoc sp. CHAB 5715]|uniref:group I intron-associated PD-(D/E)XK endonuclease n=1 Tax=Nostoc sp. CHAB 5715 TaxID=2780400 RepID=UPI001E4A6D60|nr:group I intron-associated PD-(D/E)XK endonuclease [Nostoc sp. CHAB 5715]MCC5626500.1 hypothetical protein [Nostoc sp. CHAB 5715]
MMISSIEGSLLLHHTKNKGDIAATKAIADLTLKGYLVLTPVVCEHLPFDFVAYKDDKFYNLHSADVTHITGNFEKSSPENFY